jgi:hypothetical protein
LLPRLAPVAAHRRDDPPSPEVVLLDDLLIAPPGIAKPREDVVVARVGLARACPDLGHGLSLPARMRTGNASALSAAAHRRLAASPDARFGHLGVACQLREHLEECCDVAVLVAGGPRECEHLVGRRG